MQKYDVVVIGGGHAAVEAALVCARVGCQTAMIASNPQQIGRMPCNPSIGGPAKAHLVREIDSLGGEMARAIDDTQIHIRNLNTGKGPAVQALRAQADRLKYQQRIQQAVFSQENLEVLAESAQRLLSDRETITGVVCASGLTISCGAVIICTGTFLSGILYMGDLALPGGRSGEAPSFGLSDSLRSLGLQLGRLKTGTCPRLHRDTINTDGLDILHPSNDGLVFSDLSPRRVPEHQVNCYITRTTEKTRQAITDNLTRSPLYGGAGVITGIGPRYCPSLEDKFMRFPERPFHLVFIEPEGLDAPDVYLQGVSTSMPLDVQYLMVRSLPGLEKAEIIRPGYAVEYDYVLPTQLEFSLAVRGIKGLYLAGQINGTSGYEEAAAQGIIAGINAFRYLDNAEPIIVSRDQGYVGVLIDDLVCRGTKEPYRMHTSRAEYRLLLREDNADDRFTPLAHDLGIISDKRWQLYLSRQKLTTDTIEVLSHHHLSATEAERLSLRFNEHVAPGITLSDLVRRPGISYATIRDEFSLEPLEPRVISKIETLLKYEGYIERQLSEVKRLAKTEQILIPKDLDYPSLDGFSSEAAEKLAAVKPVNIGQASRIPGVSPSDITALMVHLRKHKMVHTAKLS